jgi:Flp pilus assembly protein TadG
MFLRSHRCRRSGHTLVEATVAYPVAILLTIGLTIVGVGVFRYLQVANMAREGARYASVHGGQWAADLNSGTLTTKTDIYNNAIVPHASGLDTNQFTSSDVAVSWADSGEMPTYTSNGNTVTNIVTVTVNYRWSPALYLGSMTLSSTSKMPISY